MDGEIDLEEVYGKRLRAVNPTHQQIRDIRRAYKNNLVEDVRDTIAMLQKLGHQVYIISGGLLEPVREFGVFLGVPKENIRAVGVTYNELSGDWWVGGDEQYMTYDDGALTVSDGKAKIVTDLLAGKRGRSLLVGDGHSDLLASSAVDLFIGFGGVEQRERVRSEAPIYLHSSSLAPVIALAAGPAAVVRLLQNGQQELGRKVMEPIRRGELVFNDAQLERKFYSAVAATYDESGQDSGEGGIHQRRQPHTLDDWGSAGQARDA
jgi:phosphoserine phosphatase